MSTSAENVLKTFLKDCFKSDNKKAFIVIRTIRKNLLDIKIKEEGESGNKVIRVHTDDEKAPQWYIHGYSIPLSNLGIEKIKKKDKEIYNILNFQDGITDNDTKTLLKKINKDFGDILDDGSRNKLSYKTERFKKKKDYMKVKRKAF